ncbi:MAG: hypothetical protein HN778_08400 [Prolixibacteraceae bacterium]|nr:hypothetical protein [Prolixibacteraceae bacterium]MBT6762911.1 hypothetical protein [Prolixibacteraceae bacterium]MBT6998984.1 hypothetical protein [Prolixibacteraceae bacterium]MBT7394837.1 hypothetical protein [Prolixibacteraceae bacterium]
MKKLFLVIALIAAYGITISNASAKILNSEKTDITIVADSGSNSIVSFNNDEDPPKKKAEAKACCPGTAAKAAKGECDEAAKKSAKKGVGCTEAQVKSCAASKKTCAGEKK